MLKISTLIKHIGGHWKVYGLLLAVVLLCVYLLFQSWPSASTEKQAYPNIKPGKTTSDQLNSQVGQPYTNYTSGDYTIKTQKSAKSPYKPDQFYIKDGVVILKDVWYEPSTYYYAEKDFVAENGKPESVMYDTRPLDLVTKVDLYPQKGMAAYVYEKNGAVSHVQYFPPTTLKNYLATWGKNLGSKQDIKPLVAEPSK